MARLPVTRRPVKKSTTPLSDKVDKEHLFQKGHTKAKGRPEGSRNKATLAILAIGEEGIDDMLRKAMSMAMEGDLGAMRLILDRVCPAPKGRPVKLNLPKITNLATLREAMSMVTQEMADGVISPDEALTICQVLQNELSSVESALITVQLESIKEGLGINE